jgi:hypothetical protein
MMRAAKPTAVAHASLLWQQPSHAASGRASTLCWPTTITAVLRWQCHCHCHDSHTCDANHAASRCCCLTCSLTSNASLLGCPGCAGASASCHPAMTGSSLKGTPLRLLVWPTMLARKSRNTDCRRQQPTHGSRHELAKAHRLHPGLARRRRCANAQVQPLHVRNVKDHRS